MLCACKTDELFQKLRASEEGWERSELLLQLIEELNSCIHIEDDLFYPWRPTTWSERVLRSEEAVTQQELAKFGLYSVLVDSRMSFATRIAMIKFLVDHHLRRTEDRRITHEEAGVRDRDLDTLGERVAALHRSVPPVGLDADSSSARRGAADPAANLRTLEKPGASQRESDASVKKAA
jgi:hypothetical protein